LKLEQFQVQTSVRGIVADALEITCKTQSGKVANELLYRHDSGSSARTAEGDLFS